MYRILCSMLISASMLGLLCVPSHAVASPILDETAIFEEKAITRATGSFEMSIGANKNVSADTTFPLAAGETVHIRAYYTPENADIDFGLIDPNGTYHFVNGKNGDINTVIEVPDTANYRLAFRNHSRFTVKIAGIVEY